VRLHLHLSTDDEFIAVDHNYLVGAAIYKFLQLGSPRFASFLHDIGFNLNGKSYKLFSFALHFGKIKFQEQTIRLLSSNCDLFISSPLIDEFIQNFVIGSLYSQKIVLSDGSIKTTFNITQLDSLPDVSFQPISKFKLLSPLVLSTHKEDKEKPSQYFLRYNDDPEKINKCFNQNLKNKFKLLHSQDYSGEDLILKWDESYINKKLSENKRLTKKISIAKPGILPVEIIANEVPFELSGSTELMKVGYECGYGEKNSMGFGMGQVI